MSSASRSPERVSVVVASRDEGEQLRATVHEILATLEPNDEVIVVDDGSSDGSTASLEHGYEGVALIRPAERLGVAGARNRGSDVASGDVVVFCDAHVRPLRGWRRLLVGQLRDESVGAAGPAMAVEGDEARRGFGLAWQDDALHVGWLGQREDDAYPVPILGGAFLAVRRSVFTEVGGFDTGLVGWGGEDAELCLRLWLHGYRCVVVPQAVVVHRFKDVLTHELPADAVLHNLLRIAATHFGRDRLARTLASRADDPQFAKALARLLDGDALERRVRLSTSRAHDDEWYFDRFSPEPMEVTQ